MISRNVHKASILRQNKKKNEKLFWKAMEIDPLFG